MRAQQNKAANRPPNLRAYTHQTRWESMLEGRFCPAGAAAAGRPVYRWHTGQKKVDLPDCTMRVTVPSQPGLGQASPSRS
jgi:hypothetical protein